jgi:polyphosphate glucokinase
MRSNDSQVKTVLGIDIGGSGIKAAPVNLLSGQLAMTPRRMQLPKPSSPESICSEIGKILEHFEWSGPLGCGYPGVVKEGVVYSAANISRDWLGVDFEEMLRDLNSDSVRVINDADAAGLAEMQYGAGRERNHASGGTVLMLTLGTGIGSAFFYNGRLFPNTEFGHVYTKSGIEAEDLAAGSIRTRESLSWKVWGERVNDYLKEMNKLTSPDLMVIGGGVSENFEKFSDYLSVETAVVPALLGNDAGIVGAALTATLL